MRRAVKKYTPVLAGVYSSNIALEGIEPSLPRLAVQDGGSSRRANEVSTPREIIPEVFSLPQHTFSGKLIANFVREMPAWDGN